MTSGFCPTCKAKWSSKCHKCRNVFFEELTQEQFDCPHTGWQANVMKTPEICIYSGCEYENPVDKPENAS